MNIYSAYIPSKVYRSIYDCKRSSINRMAAGSSLQVQVMDFFFFHLLFKHA